MTNVVKKIKKEKPIVLPTLDFGVPASTDPHCFIVRIPKSNNDLVLISENLGMQSRDRSLNVIERAALERPRWNAVRLSLIHI